MIPREFQKMAVLETDFHEVEVQYSANLNFYRKSYETQEMLSTECENVAASTAFEIENYV